MSDEEIIADLDLLLNYEAVAEPGDMELIEDLEEVEGAATEPDNGEDQ